MTRIGVDGSDILEDAADNRRSTHWGQVLESNLLSRVHHGVHGRISRQLQYPPPSTFQTLT